MNLIYLISLISWMHNLSWTKFSANARPWDRRLLGRQQMEVPHQPGHRWAALVPETMVPASQPTPKTYKSNIVIISTHSNHNALVLPCTQFGLASCPSVFETSLEAWCLLPDRCGGKLLQYVAVLETSSKKLRPKLNYILHCGTLGFYPKPIHASLLWFWFLFFTFMMSSRFARSGTAGPDTSLSQTIPALLEFLCLLITGGERSWNFISHAFRLPGVTGLEGSSFTFCPSSGLTNFSNVSSAEDFESWFASCLQSFAWGWSSCLSTLLDLLGCSPFMWPASSAFVGWGAGGMPGFFNISGKVGAPPASRSIILEVAIIAWDEIDWGSPKTSSHKLATDSLKLSIFAHATGFVRSVVSWLPKASRLKRTDAGTPSRQSWSAIIDQTPQFPSAITGSGASSCCCKRAWSRFR